MLHNESGLKGARLQPPHMQGGSFSPSVRMENATNPLVQRGPVLSSLFPFARESQVCVRGLKSSNQELSLLLSLTRGSSTCIPVRLSRVEVVIHNPLPKWVDMLISSMRVGVLEDVLHESMKRIHHYGFLPYSPIRNSPVPAILHYVQFNGVWNDHSSLLRFGWNSLLCVWMKGIVLQS